MSDIEHIKYFVDKTKGRFPLMVSDTGAFVSCDLHTSGRVSVVTIHEGSNEISFHGLQEISDLASVLTAMLELVK